MCWNDNFVDGIVINLDYDIWISIILFGINLLKDILLEVVKYKLMLMEILIWVYIILNGRI